MKRPLRLQGFDEDRAPFPDAVEHLLSGEVSGKWWSLFDRWAFQLSIALLTERRFAPFFCRRGLYSSVRLVVGEPVNPQAVTPEGLQAVVSELRGNSGRA